MIQWMATGQYSRGQIVNIRSYYKKYSLQSSVRERQGQRQCRWWVRPSWAKHTPFVRLVILMYSYAKSTGETQTRATAHWWEGCVLWRTQPSEHSLVASKRDQHPNVQLLKVAAFIHFQWLPRLGLCDQQSLALWIENRPHSSADIISLQMHRPKDWDSTIVSVSDSLSSCSKGPSGIHNNLIIIYFQLQNTTGFFLQAGLRVWLSLF